jgi:hypothetical protein
MVSVDTCFRDTIPLNKVGTDDFYFVRRLCFHSRANAAKSFHPAMLYKCYGVPLHVQLTACLPVANITNKITTSNIQLLTGMTPVLFIFKLTIAHHLMLYTLTLTKN